MSVMASTSGFYPARRPGSVPSQDARRLSAVESAVHALQQQHSGASTQLSAFSTRLDNLEDRIGQRIADALEERDLNQTRPVNQSRVKIPREVSVSCLPGQSIFGPMRPCRATPYSRESELHMVCVY